MDYLQKAFRVKGGNAGLHMSVYIFYQTRPKSDIPPMRSENVGGSADKEHELPLTWYSTGFK